ncbi:MAG: T9SS type A sorting domain-containing protein, partial [Bacteroidota bacterium]
ITFSVPAVAGRENPVTLRVFDALGREVKTLVNEYLSPGEYSVRFNAEDFASGVYLYRLTVGLSAVSKRMILMK